MRRFLSTAFVAVATIAFVAPAHAEGIQLAPSQVRVDAGDQIELTAHVADDPSGEGPFFAYLHGQDYGVVVTEVPGGAATDVPVGELHIQVADTEAEISVMVTIPEETPSGSYEIVICNDPCTTGLGSLNGTTLYVGMEPPANDATPPTTIAVEVLTTSTAANVGTSTTTYLALGHHPERSTRISPLWIAFPVTLGAVVLVMALLSRNRG